MKNLWLIVLCWMAGAAWARADATFNLAPVGGIVMAPDGRTMIVSVPSEGKLVYFDTVQEKEIRRVEVDFQPTLLAVQGKKLFATLKGSPKIFVLNLDTGEATGHITLPGEPLYSLGCHPKQGLLYAVNLAHEVLSIDVQELSHKKTQAKGQYLAVDPTEGKFVYTGIQKPIRDVLVIEEAAGGKVRISLAEANLRAVMLKYKVAGADLTLVAANDNAAINGRAMAVDKDGKHVAMAGGGGWRSKKDPRANYSIAVFDAGNMATLVGQVETGPYPNNIAFHPLLNLGAAFNTKEVVVFNSKSFVKKESFKTTDDSFNHSGYLLFGGLGTKVIHCSYNAPLMKNSVLQIFSLRLTQGEQDLLRKAHESAPLPVGKEDKVTKKEKAATNDPVVKEKKELVKKVTPEKPIITIFMVNGEPEKYLGQKVVFEKAVLLAGTIQRGDEYELQVGNEKAAKPNGLTFSLSKKLANKLAEEGRLPENQPVHLTCTILRVGDRWHARVSRVALIGKDGQVETTLADE